MGNVGWVSSHHKLIRAEGGRGADHALRAPCIRASFRAPCDTEKFEDTADGREVAPAFLGAACQVAIEPLAGEGSGLHDLLIRGLKFMLGDPLFVGVRRKIVIWDSVDQRYLVSSFAPPFDCELALGFWLRYDGCRLYLESY